MARITLSYDQAAEAQLLEQIRSLTLQLNETLRQLTDAKAELEIRHRIAVGSVPAWLRPAKNLSIAHVVVNALDSNRPSGLKFGQLVDELQRAGRDVKRPSLTAILGRLKKGNKVIRRNGRWLTVHYEYKPVPEKEYEKED